MEIIGYKKTYTYVVKAGFQQMQYARKFETEAQGDKWLALMEEEFKGLGGCHLYDCLENIEPIYKDDVDTSKIDAIIARLEAENEARRRFKGRHRED